MCSQTNNGAGSGDCLPLPIGAPSDNGRWRKGRSSTAALEALPTPASRGWRRTGARAERSDLLALGGASTSGLFGDRTRNFYVMYREMTNAG